jgi:hypothetical protein
MAPNLTLTPEQTQAEGTLAPAPAALPSAAAPTLAAAPANIAGATALGSTDDQAADAALKMRVGQPAPADSFAAKLGAALDRPENAIPLTAAGTPVKGAWARSLVAGAQGVLASMGDIPTGKAPVGAGAISGIAGTMRNRNERIGQQNELKNKEAQEAKQNAREDRKMTLEENSAALNNTESNLRMHNEQRLAHQADVAPMIDQGKKAIEVLTNPASPHQAPVAGRDLTYADIQQGVVDGKWNLQDFTAFPTGQKFKEGQEPTTTYTLVGAGQPVKLDAKNPADAATIKFINDNRGADKPITDGQDFTFDQFNHVYQNAADVAAATASRDKTLMDNKLMSAKQVKDLEPALLGQNPMWIKAIGDAKGDPVAAYKKISANPSMLKQFPNLAEDMKVDYPEFDKLTEMHETEAAKIREKNADAAANISGIPMTDEMQASINSLPADKKALLVGAAPKDTTLQATLYSLALNDGTVDIDKVFPNRTYKGGQTMTLQDAIGVVKQMNPQMSEQNYRLMGKELAATIPGTKKGDAIEQYNNVLQHAAELQDTMMAVGGERPAKFYNTGLNKMEKEGWGTDPANISAAMEPLKGEFELLMSGGYKPSEEMQVAYNVILNPASTPNQIGVALKKMAAVGSIRLQNMDETYHALAGKHIPNLVRPEALAAAQHLGLEGSDPQSWARLKSLNSGGQVFTPGIPPEVKPADLTKVVPNGALNMSVAADGKTTIFQMPGNKIQDAQGNQYDVHGNRLPGAK